MIKLKLEQANSLPGNFSFERDGAPVSDREAKRDGFFVEGLEDAISVIQMLETSRQVAERIQAANAAKNSQRN